MGYIKSVILFYFSCCLSRSKFVAYRKFLCLLRYRITSIFFFSAVGRIIVQSCIGYISGVSSVSCLFSVYAGDKNSVFIFLCAICKVKQ